MRVRAVAVTRRARHARSLQRALLLDLPGNEQLSPSAARAISGSSVYKWRVIISRVSVKPYVQHFYDMTDVLKYIEHEHSANFKPIKRIMIDAVDG
jgi:hypothetical protein